MRDTKRPAHRPKLPADQKRRKRVVNLSDPELAALLAMADERGIGGQTDDQRLGMLVRSILAQWNAPASS